MFQRLTRVEYDTLLRQDFAAFATRCFHDLNPQAELAMNWHIEVIAAKLAAVRQGKIRRMIINLPPRHLKSLLTSIAFPAWCLGHDPSAQLLCVSYAQDLSDKLARDCRNIMTSAWYRRIFPTRLAAQRQAVQEFVTTRQGYRLATSNGGVLTGRGADIILIDDPLKPEEALSDAQRQAANDWFDHTLYSRQNDKRHGAIVIVMQRLHEDDLVGHVLGQEPWEVVCFPAIAEQDEVYQIETLWGRKSFARRRGKALHPAREPLTTLDHIRHTVGEYNFAGQYQQSPAPLGGGLVKAEWFKGYGAKDLPERFDRIVQSWDTANKATELSDYSVCTTWGITGKNLYLLGLLRRRLEYPALKRAVREQQSLYNANVVLIEDKASGTQLIQELIGDGCHAVTRYQPECDKIMRLHAQTAIIENGFRPNPRNRPLARRIPPRDDHLPQGQTRRPGRLDRPVPRLVQNAIPGSGDLRILPANGRRARTAAETAACPNRMSQGLDGIARRPKQIEVTAGSRPNCVINQPGRERSSQPLIANRVARWHHAKGKAANGAISYSLLAFVL